MKNGTLFRLISMSALLGAVSVSFVARAEESEVATAPVDPPAPKPAPYSLPWQLRSVSAGNVLRSDTSAAFYEDTASKGGATLVTMLLASYKIPGTGGAGEGLAPLLRLAAVNDSPPAGNGGLTLVNPLVGASYALKLGSDVRLAAFFAATIPIGGGGGDSPNPGSANSRSKGIFARASMDNAMFAVNDFTLIPGIGAAYVAHRLTVQVEATLLELIRVRGDAVQHEATKTNLTAGLHVGYFVLDSLSIGADLRYQLWLNAPIAIDTQREVMKNNSGMDNATFALGPRYHAKIGDSMWLRPGVSYGRGLDKPTSGATPNYHIVQLDIPFQF